MSAYDPPFIKGYEAQPQPDHDRLDDLDLGGRRKAVARHAGGATTQP
jgi:hypothetical protein